MRVVYFGSGEFGLPTFQQLAQRHEMVLAVTQPDRPAGRGRRLTRTPIAAAAEADRLPVLRVEDVNQPEVIERIRAMNADAFVVIAFGQKLRPALLGDTFAINLHGSLLPKYRGAAPVNWAIISGERETGVSVIALAQKMDAGAILAQRATPIDPLETAGELHDRLAAMGPEAVVEVLDQFQRGELHPVAQDDRLATPAPKLTRADGTVDFNQPAESVRCRVHGLTPWPGCTIRIAGRIAGEPLRLLRVNEASAEAGDGVTPGPPGIIMPNGTIACAAGAIRPLSVQPPGGKMMSFDAYCRGHAVRPGDLCEAIA